MSWTSSTPLLLQSALRIHLSNRTIWYPVVLCTFQRLRPTTLPLLLPWGWLQSPHPVHIQCYSASPKRALCPDVSLWQFNWIGPYWVLVGGKGYISPPVQIQKEAKQLPGPLVNQHIHRLSQRSPDASRRQWSQRSTGGGMSWTAFGTKSEPAVSACNQLEGRTTCCARVRRHASSYLGFIYGPDWSAFARGHFSTCSPNWDAITVLHISPMPFCWRSCWKQRWSPAVASTEPVYRRAPGAMTSSGTLCIDERPWIGGCEGGRHFFCCQQACSAAVITRKSHIYSILLGCVWSCITCRGV